MSKDQVEQIQTGIFLWTPETWGKTSIQEGLNSLKKSLEEDKIRVAILLIDVSKSGPVDFQFHDFIKEEISLLPVPIRHVCLISRKSIETVTTNILKSTFGSRLSFHRSHEEALDKAKSIKKRRYDWIRMRIHRILSAEDSRLAFPSAVVMTVLMVLIPSLLIFTQRNMDKNLESRIREDQLQKSIVYLDEVLTMTARMASFTGDSQWKFRYSEHEILLDNAIQTLLELQKQSGTDSFSHFIKETDIANQKLISLERQAFELTGKGQLKKAQGLLLGKEYLDLKRDYSNGILNNEKHSKELLTRNLEKFQNLQQVIIFFWGIVSFCWIGILLYLYIAKKKQSLLRSRKEAAEQQMIQAAKLASIGELAAGVGHEILNPVAIVQGHIRKLERLNCYEGENLEKASGSFEKMRVALKRVSAIVEGLRTYSRADSRESEILDLHELIPSTLELVKTIYERTGITIETKLLAQDPKVSGNLGRFQQVIMNLITNSGHALEGRSEKTIRIETQNQPGQLTLKFSDTGKGIKEEHLSRIFDPFFTTKPIGKGTGIGMSTILNIVKEMGGDITVSSKYGEGTCFTVILPLAASSTKTPKKAA